jgi:fructose-1,6-bisphosphatase/inositol monophosphatase family enzyme
MLPDAEKVGALLREIAAEELTPKFKTLDPAEIDEKSPGDFVTSVDYAMEARLQEMLPALAPGSTVLGEEAAAHDRAVLDLLDGDAPVWVVDPLDGTANFAAGLPLFAVIVAYVQAGETRMGWIYDPLADRMVVASAGEGAWMDGRRLAVRRPAESRELNGSIYGRVFRTSEPFRRIWSRGRGPLGHVFNARCVGQEYLARVLGRMHFGLYTRLNPWDHAAGCLIHAEAGGHVALFDGTPYRPARRDGPGTLLTPDRDLWEEIHRALVAPALAAAGR